MVLSITDDDFIDDVIGDVIGDVMWSRNRLYILLCILSFYSESLLKRSTCSVPMQTAETVQGVCVSGGVAVAFLQRNAVHVCRSATSAHLGPVRLCTVL